MSKALGWDLLLKKKKNWSPLATEVDQRTFVQSKRQVCKQPLAQKHWAIVPAAVLSRISGVSVERRPLCSGVKAQGPGLDRLLPT